MVTLEKSRDFKVIQMDKNGNANYLSQDIVNSVKVSVNTVQVDAFLPINLVAASFDLYF